MNKPEGSNLNSEQIKRVSKMLKDVARQAWNESKTGMQDFNQWWAKRNKTHLNKNQSTRKDNR